VSAAAFALLGPTASGKSPLALDLSTRFPLEIVSVDSGQVYRGMDIGTAKPTAEERKRVPHHLIDLVEPTEGYNAGRFRDDAIRAVQDILGRKRIPLLVGGTMLYYKALVSGLDSLPGADREVRNSIDEKAKALGWPALHAELAKVDPKAAGRIMPNDAQRIQRALEVYRLSGQPISSLQKGAPASLPFELKAFAIMPKNRVDLHRRIAERFDRMLKEGLIEEVEALRKRHALNARTPSMRCVGYRQVWNFLENKTSRDELRNAALAATRQLAKRQMTWLRSLPDLRPSEDLAPALQSG
jgi:tRNA dimethylallyltransferase